MASICTQCGNVYDTAGSCPRCAAGFARVDSDIPIARGARWQQTFWGRVFIGLILAQGLFYGLRHLLTGLLLATLGEEAQELWEGIGPLLFLQGVQLFTLLVGGLIAGGGQQQGLVLGALVGAWNGVLAVVLRQNPGQELTMVGLYGQPLLHAAFGAVGGWLGSVIWKPIPTSLPLLLSPQRKKAPRRNKPLLAGKIHWVRVLIGAAAAVAGTLSATILFRKVIDASGGHLGTDGLLQDRIITWEIKALALLGGGVLSGAATPNGLKQGLIAGLAASVLLIGIQAPKTDAWMELAGWTFISTFTLISAGGWFGAQLFPQVIKVNRRANLRTSAMV
jgi:hypothetical protein